jgi:hypothetical protein
MMARRTRQDTCPKGHLLADAFLHKRGSLECRTCKRDGTRRRRGITPDRFYKRGRPPRDGAPP